MGRYCVPVITTLSEDAVSRFPELAAEVDGVVFFTPVFVFLL
jgi:hypothetical protein